jgi:hypothetical protein
VLLHALVQSVHVFFSRVFFVSSKKITHLDLPVLFEMQPQILHLCARV